MFRKGLTALTILVSAGVLAASVRLRWDQNLESDLAGYRFYVRVAPYTNDLAAFDVHATNFVWTNAVIGVRYQFSVSAYNTAGLESARTTIYFTPTNSGSVLAFPGSYVVKTNRFN